MAKPRPVHHEYEPQPRQLLFHTCQANEVLYGGAAGGGKSVALRNECFMWCMRIPNLEVYLFRRTYGELEDTHIRPSQKEFPRGAAVYKKQDKRWEFKNGSALHFKHCQREDDVYLYLSSEIHLLAIDELTTFSEVMYDLLRSRVRCALPISEEYKYRIPGIITASNPGGIGHAFVKRRWVDFSKNDIGLPKRAPANEGGMTRCYIPAKLNDNPALTDADPTYVDRVNALPEPLRTAYLEGDWDIHLGSAFFFSIHDHVCKPLPIPEFAPIYMTFDWGYGRPFSVGWWWVDNDGRIYRFAEWYGCVPNRPDTGLRLPDSKIAEGIIEREETMGIRKADIIRLCDPTCFNKTPDKKGGGQGPSTADIFDEHDLALYPGDPNRKLKFRQFQERLRTFEDGTKPLLQIYSSCEEFIRTIPLLQMHPQFQEDVDTNGEDHIYDEACHVMMARPVGVDLARLKEEKREREHKEQLSKLDSASRKIAEDLYELKKQNEQEFFEDYLDW